MIGGWLQVRGDGPRRAAAIASDRFAICRGPEAAVEVEDIEHVLAVSPATVASGGGLAPHPAHLCSEQVARSSMTPPRRRSRAPARTHDRPLRHRARWGSWTRSRRAVASRSAPAVGRSGRKGKMERQPVVLYVLALVAVVVGVDILFFRNRFWERLMVNVGIVLVFAAFYLRFLKRP